MSSGAPSDVESIRTDIECLAKELDNALARFEGVEGALDWKLRSRLLRLEAEYLLANRPAPTLSAWQRVVAFIRATLSFLAELLGKLAPVATPLAVAIVGYFLTGTYAELLELRRVEVAEQQLDLSTIQAMDQAFEKFRERNIGTDEAKRIAVSIVRFGPRAISPLVAELSNVTASDEPRAIALQHALVLSALYPAQRDRLCSVLRQAMQTGKDGALGVEGVKIAQDVSENVKC